MKLGINITSNDPETVWNALRLGEFALKQGDAVSLFLLGKGVEIETLDMAQFEVTKQLNALIQAGGTVKACGTCLKLRQAQATEACPISTMADLHALIARSDKVLTF
jgi:uncharacterized protein involved in oxidation of intracellular sulfur